MVIRAKLKDVSREWAVNRTNITLSILEGNLQELNDIQDIELAVDIKPYKKKRSLNANRLFWKCVGMIAAATKNDNWSTYINQLKKYGKFTYLCVRPSAVEGVKKVWREAEEIGHVDINGEDAVQMICYYGSHLYNTQEFSRLLECTISDMKDLGLPTPSNIEIERSLALWESCKSKKNVSPAEQL